MLSDDSDNESIHQLTINEAFAKAYEYKKEREELAKLKEKYGSDYENIDEDEEDSEEAESEDEDGEELTPAVDAAILRTLARIKKKDPSIYESGKDVFEEERKKTRELNLSKRSSKDKSKPVTIRQQVLESVLHPTSRSPSPEPKPLTHVEEQRALQKETIEAFHGAIGGDDEDEDDLLIPREKTKDEIEQEEEEYREYLKREVGEDLSGLVTVDENGVIVEEGEGDGKGEEDKEDKKDKKEKKKKSKEPRKSKQEEDHEFLMNYILNRGWIDKSERRLPTYKEITGSKKKRKGKSADGESSAGEGSSSEEERIGPLGGSDPDDLSQEEEFDEVADHFESTYNFRFEEPGGATIPRYPRQIESVVRRQDSSRKEARERKKARKEEEMMKKREEVKRLKALKMKEIREKLELISKEGGKSLEETKALQELDLEGDWDPEAHDRQMREIYEKETGDLPIDEKPTWDDDIDIGDIVPPEALESDNDMEPSSSKAEKKKKKKKKKKGGEDEWDEGGVDVDEMDADVQQKRMDADGEEWDGTDEMRKRKLEEYMEDVYNLDFNDMVGDMPTRFKYTKVKPQSFDLTPAEILLATDSELNQYLSIKKYAPYRKDQDKLSKWDKSRIERLKELKARLRDRNARWLNGESLDDLQNGGGGGEGNGRRANREVQKKRKGKKERMKEKAAKAPGGSENGDDGARMEQEPKASEDGSHSSGKKEKKDEEKKRKKDAEESPSNVAETQNDASEEPSRKKRRRHHKKSAQASES
ncbi:Krr1-domain-containing protein [Panus rudis PR-1116 ss-1]|nr:Krr1-domain-containing protein [Panus rudis PR-1116 ss-1]